MRLSYVAVLVLATAARAGTLHVPGDYGTIQAALDASVVDDIVLVAPGTYVEAVVFPLHSVTLKSEGGAAVTTIDAAGAGPAVTIQSLQQLDSVVVSGFTLTGGTGLAPLFPAGPASGGGLHVANNTDSSVVVELCVITGNHVPGSGGGVFTQFTPFSMYACEIVDNSAGVDGGGALIGSNLGPVGPMEDCVARGNSAGGNGGGLWLSGGTASGWLIEENTAQLGGGIYAYSGGAFTDIVLRANVAVLDGGGAYFTTSVHPGSHMLYEDNQAGRDGGGFLARRQTGIVGQVAEAEDVVCHGNTAVGNGGGGAIIGVGAPSLLTNLHSITLRRSEFAGNQAGGQGGGLYVDMHKFGQNSTYACSLIHCTLADNQAASGGGLRLSLDGTTRVVRSSILWGNSAPQLLMGAADPAPSVTYTDVQSGWPGLGNIAANPLFVDSAGGDYGIKGGSPCVDSGDPLDPADADGSQADMGARAFQPWSVDGPGLAGAAGTPALVGAGLNEPGSSAHVTLSGAAALAPAFIVLGDVKIAAPFKGGTLVPEPDWVVPLGLTDASGGLDLASTWPPLPSDTHVWVQMWMVDGSGPAGFTASNGLLAITR